ncbi:MAG: hypothetical protein RR220_07250 [Bacteroidaceae bacterium]
MIKIKNSLTFLAICFLLINITSCKDDDNEALSPTQGEVYFQFSKVTTYTLADLEDIASVKIVLEKDGKKIYLPSQIMTGNKEVLTSPAVRLEAGAYKIVSYQAFGKDANLIENLDITFTTKNDFEVKPQTTLEYVLPVKIKEVVDTNNIRNVLYALCKEVIGNDRTKWPKTWNAEKEFDTWEGLSFELDEAGNIVSISDLVIDGEETEYYNPTTKETVKHGLPEFKHMKKLTSAIINLPSLQGIVIRNCDFEELPDNIGESKIVSLIIENTNFSTFPDSFAKMKRLNSLSLKGNKVTKIPEEIGNIETLISLEFINEQLTEVPASIGKLKKLDNLRLMNTNISTLPDVFDQLYKISVLDLQGNENLSSLPKSIGNLVIGDEGNPAEGILPNKTNKYLRGLILDRCAFTAIPNEVKNKNMLFLSMAGNKITEVTAADIAAMPNLHTLILNRNSLKSFPRINSDKLIMLSLIGCGLTAKDVDKTGMPNLTRLFFTQEEYDEAMKAGF